MRLIERCSGAVFLLGLLAIWELVARIGIVSPTQCPAPSVIAVAAVREFATSDLGAQLLVTARHFTVGFLIAGAVGIPCGFALGRWPLLYAAFEPIIEFLRPMPVVAVLPIAVFILGLRDIMAYSVIAFGTGWIVLLHAMDGIRGVDPVLVETGRTFSVSGARLFFTIIVPAAAPHTFTGLRVGLGIALILAVVIELIAGFGGLGTYIGVEQGAFQIPETYAGIAVIGLLGYALGRFFQVIETRLMAWHRGYTGR